MVKMNASRRRFPRLALGLLALLTVVTGPAGDAGARSASSADRALLTVSIRGQAETTGPVCLVLRDKTENMVVGSYCDNDATDQDPAARSILIDLPHRSFSVDVQAPGAEVRSVSPRSFTLDRDRTIQVTLAKPRADRGRRS
jgi:hypothetical protein